mmetsp:Transcript_26663/g.74539  ORF Transcript_26663/g.74539 Transcript_26663/m.74539 type:complete len:186 (+) Transcript_26663:51-608(+)
MGEANDIHVASVVLAAVALGLAVSTHGNFPITLDDDISDKKPFGSFGEFFPFYLNEHSDPVCRLLHVIGTTIVSAYVLIFHRAAILHMVFAGSIGFMACEIFRFSDHGALEAAVIFSLFVIMNATFSNKIGYEPILIGYFFAWVGHFYFEQNKPATFIYPAYSLASDYYMMYLVYTRQLLIGLYI